MPIRYYALIGDGETEPSGLMRETNTRTLQGVFRLERLDVGGKWVLDYSLVRYTHNGEMGAELISEAEAEKIKAALTHRWQQYEGKTRDETGRWS